MLHVLVAAARLLLPTALFKSEGICDFTCDRGVIVKRKAWAVMWVVYLAGVAIALNQFKVPRLCRHCLIAYKWTWQQAAG